MKLPKSKILALILFFTLPIGGFYLGVHYQEAITTPSSDNTQAEYCKSQDQKTCYESDNCLPNYGPSCPVCHDIGYHGCVYSDSKSSLRIICENTNGQWDTTYNSEDAYKQYSCICPSQESFNQETGCTASSSQVKYPVEICKENKGNWISEYGECENLNQSICEQEGGIFNECDTLCRHETGDVYCADVCVAVCSF